MFYTSPGALAQILTNLVMNSLIHAWEPEHQGQMQLTVWQDGETLRLRYRDDGRGIAPEMLPLIFDPFFTTRRGDGGSGLGLHIVFNLANQTLGGTIRAESTVGQGLTFELAIPVKVPDHAISSPDRLATASPP